MELTHYLNKHYKKSTARSYERTIEAYRKHLPTAAEGTYQDVVAYLRKLRERYPNPKTVAMALSGIRAYYRYLTDTHQRADNPTTSVRLRGFRRAIQLQDLLSEEELNMLLETPCRFYSLNLRNRVLLGLLVYQALLPPEISMLRTEDINLSTGTIYLRGSEKTRSRTLPLRPGQVMELYHYLIERKKSLVKEEAQDRLMLSRSGGEMSSRMVSRYASISLAGGLKSTNKKVTVTIIRQSVIRNLLKAGNDLRAVQVFAGHKRLSSTQHYKELNEGTLQRALEQFHPMR